MATYRGIIPVTIIAGLTGSVTIPRGCRCSLSTDGSNTCYLQDATKRGDYVAMQDIAPGLAGAAIRLGGEGVVLTSVTVALGDPTYTAAGGQVTNVATNATYIGRFRDAGAAGTLVPVLFEGAP